MRYKEMYGREQVIRKEVEALLEEEIRRTRRLGIYILLSTLGLILYLIS
jgi:hypothetical protein